MKQTIAIDTLNEQDGSMTSPNAVLQQILDSVHAHTVIFQRNRIILANARALAWLSITDEQLKSYSLQNLIHPESHLAALEGYNAVLNGETDVSVRLAIRHPSRGRMWIDATIKAADYVGQENCWLATFVPGSNLSIVTSETRQEIEINILDDTALEKSHNAINSLNYRYVDSALEDFLSTLHDIIPYDSASIVLIDNETMRFVATRGLPDNLLGERLEFNVEKSLVKAAEILLQNAHGTVQVINDTLEHPSWIHVPGVNHIRSWMGVELKYEDKVLGILNIDSSTPDFFTKDYARYALALAQQAIIALVYTRLYRQFYDDFEERKRLQQILVKNLISTETMFAAQELLFSSSSLAESLPDLINIVSSSMDDTRILIVIFNVATDTLIHRAQSGSNTDGLWQVFKEVAGYPGLEEGMMPPGDLKLPANGFLTLSNGQQTMAAVVNQRGALIALRDKETIPFDETDHELIITIADQISIALENETLNAKIKQHNEHLERLVNRRTAQLSVEKKRLNAILDSTAEGIFYMENFRIQYANPAFCRMVGYSLDELYGKPLSYVRVSQEVSEQQNFNSLLENPLEVKPGRSETRLRHKDGIEFYASIRFSLVGKPGEDPVRMVAIARDISQERNLYIQRARFIANAAHELRTPLSSLILRLHMLRRQPERMPDHLESLDKVTGYLKELVEELLTLSRFERGSISLDKDDFVLQELIRQAADEQMPFAEEQGVIVHIELTDEPIPVHVDGNRMHQMMSNLIVNAINYSSKEDNVYVKLSVEIDTVGNKNAIIHVIDEGAGIEPELLPVDIFEPFARPSGGSRKETGMGLALVREIITLHGGTIHAKSKLDEGATFRVNLPIN